MHLSMADGPIGIVDWIALGITTLLLISTVVISVIGNRNRHLPMERRNKELDRNLERIGLPLKILGAGTVAVLGIMKIMGWKF